MSEEIKAILQDIKAYIVDSIPDYINIVEAIVAPEDYKICIVIENNYDFNILGIIYGLIGYLRKNKYGLVLDTVYTYAIVRNECDRLLRVYIKIVFEFA